jgi:hypothetical protein
MKSDVSQASPKFGPAWQTPKLASQLDQLGSLPSWSTYCQLEDSEDTQSYKLGSLPSWSNVSLVIPKLAQCVPAWEVSQAGPTFTACVISTLRCPN